MLSRGIVLHTRNQAPVTIGNPVAKEDLPKIVQGKSLVDPCIGEKGVTIFSFVRHIKDWQCAVRCIGDDCEPEEKEISVEGFYYRF